VVNVSEKWQDFPTLRDQISCKSLKKRKHTLISYGEQKEKGIATWSD
jgi:hypothetical protein